MRASILGPLLVCDDMRAETLTDPAAFVNLAEDWESLAGQDPSATVFHLPQYLGIWWNEFGSSCEELAVVALREADQLRGVCALTRHEGGVVRFAGDPDVTDYLGPVSCSEDRDVVAAAVIKEARTIGQRLEFNGLAAESGWPDAFAAAAKEAGLTASIVELDACPRISVAEGFDAYLAALSGKLRHEIRRKERRLREAGEMIVRISDPSTIDHDLETFFTFTRADDGGKGDFFGHHARASFFSAIGAAFLNHGLLRVVVLELDGVPLGVDIGFARNGVWSLYNMSYERERSDLAPGMVLVGETIRLATIEGCSTFDFLRGREPYKYRFGAMDGSVLTVSIE